jgi:hypothetical protein
MGEDTRDLAVVVDEYGLSTTKAREIIDNFSDVFELADRWEQQARQIVVSDENDTHLMAAARALRLEIRERRLAVENKRKELKEDALREGRAIDGVANILKGIMQPLEKYLDQQEHYAEIMEKQREEERRRKAEELLREQERQEAEARAKAEEEERQRQIKEAEAARKEAEQKAAEEAEKRRAAEKKAEAEREAWREQEAKRQAAEQKRREAEQREREEAEKRHQEELLAAREKAASDAARVKCPKCGTEFDSREHKA